MSLFLLRFLNGDFVKKSDNGYIYYDYHKKTEKEEISDTAWRSVFHWVYAIVGTLFVLFVVLMFFVRFVSVDGSSMSPTLSDGDKLLVYTCDYEPEQGDIVLICSTVAGEQTLVKRVIALEGQVVEIDYDAGTVTVDGSVIQEDYVSDMSIASLNEVEYPYTVPENCVFVLGDNRNDSTDSRNRRVDAIDESRIVGEVVMRVYPFPDFALFEDIGGVFS